MRRATIGRLGASHSPECLFSPQIMAERKTLMASPPLTRQSSGLDTHRTSALSSSRSNQERLTTTRPLGQNRLTETDDG